MVFPCHGPPLHVLGHSRLSILAAEQRRADGKAPGNFCFKSRNSGGYAEDSKRGYSCIVYYAAEGKWAERNG